MTTTTTKTLKELHETIINSLKASDRPDGTYDIETMESVSFKKGFQVSFYTIGMNYTAETYEYICNMFAEHSMDGKTYIGYFDGCPEISFRIADKATARNLAKQFNQMSIWNWKKCKTINTHGTGRSN